MLAGQPPVIEGTDLETAPAADGPTTTEPSSAPAKPGTPAASTSSVGAQFDLVARLIKGGLPTRVYVVSAGGFDTHGNEQPTQDKLLADLDGAITGFVTAMAADRRADAW